MKLTKSIFILLLISGISSAVFANNKLRVLDQGIDGANRTYLVTCPDGTYSSVVQEYEPRKTGNSEPVRKPGVLVMDTNNMKPPKLLRVCIYPHAGKDKCQTSWDVDAAAKESCQR